MQKKEVNHDIFASVYLTLLGVVQATVFTDLCFIALRRINTDGEIDTLDTLLNSLTFSGMMPIVFGFVVILLVTYEYIYFVQTASRFVQLFDVFPLFLLGFSEVVIVRSLDSPLMTWVGMICLSIAGTIAFANSFFYDWNSIFNNRRISIIYKAFLFFRMIVCIGSGYLSYLIIRRIDDGIIDESNHSYVLMVYALLFGLFFFLSWPPLQKLIFSSQSEPENQNLE